jgi:hypothetical protein
VKQLSKFAFHLTFGLLILAIALGTPLAAMAAGNQQITATPQAENNLYGQAVAVYNEYAIVGVPEADMVSQDAGAAHIYKRVNNVWQPEATLLPELTTNALFGYSVALTVRNGVEYALVGAPQDGISGAAYLFQHDAQGQWTQIAALRPTSSEAVEFGYSVAIFENQILIGAPQDTLNTPAGGEAYLYKDTSANWTQLQTSKLSETLIARGITLLQGDRFGEAVALAGQYMVVGAPERATQKGAAYLFKQLPSEMVLRNLTEIAQPMLNSRFGASVGVNIMGDVIIGAPQDSQVAAQAGAAFLLKRDGQQWQAQTKLMPVNEIDAQFGTSVAMHLDKAIVGAPYRDLNGTVDAGSVFVYRKEANNWLQRAVTPDNLVADGLFGRSVAIFGDLAIAGAPGSTITADLGSVLVLRRDGFNKWMLDAKLSFEMMSQFGQAIAMHEDIAIIGAPEHDALAQDAGAVYLYERDQQTGQWMPAAMDPTAQTLDYKLQPQQQLLAGDMFGYAVDLHRASTGEYYAIVSAPYRDANSMIDSGAVYIFQRDETTKIWTQVIDPLTNLGVELTGQIAYELFGYDVAISELANVEHFLIGAPADATQVNVPGMAELYKYEDFTVSLLQTFSPTELIADAQFGYSVDILADKLIIGAPSDDTVIADLSGAAYLYEAQLSDWQLIPTYVKLQAQELDANVLFGYDVAITLSEMGEHFAIVGAPQDSTLAQFAGAAYAFKLDEATQIWNQFVQLLPDLNQVNARFGETIALFKNELLIGARGEELQRGAAYQFRLQEQTQTFVKLDKLTLPTLQQGDVFGTALAINGSELMITAPMGDLLSMDAGFVSAFAIGQ